MLSLLLTPLHITLTSSCGAMSATVLKASVHSMPTNVYSGSIMRSGR